MRYTRNAATLDAPRNWPELVRSHDRLQFEVRASELTLTADNLPPGIIGRVAGKALPLDVIDSYETVFRRGCTDKTRAKVRKGKVKLHADHEYGIAAHVGTVRTLELIENVEHMTADIFNTRAGREAHEYVQAVLSSGGETGLSIGFYGREGAWEKIEGRNVFVFTEIELDEISLTPRPAVPGASVTDVREMSADTRASLARQIARGLSREQWNALYVPGDDESRRTAVPAPGDDESQNAATPDERLAAVRRAMTSSLSR